MNDCRPRQRTPLEGDYNASFRACRDSCGLPPLRSMMKSTESGKCDNLGIANAERGARNAESRSQRVPRGVCVFPFESGFRVPSSPFRVGMMPFVKDDHMVEAFPSDGSDDTLHERRLPRTPRRDAKWFDAHVLDLIVEGITVDSIPISEQVFRRSVPGKCLDNLLGGPLGGGIGCDIGIHDSPAIVTQDDEDVEKSERHGVDHKEVD